MKRYLLSFAVILLSLSSYAQFTQGTMMIGGTFGFELNTDKYKLDGNTTVNYRSASFSLEPQFGIFVSDNLALGAGLGLSVVSGKNEQPFYEYTSTYSLVAFQPFVRYYLPQRIFFQGKLILGVASNRIENDTDSDSESSLALGAGLSAGYSIRLNDNIALEPQIGYESIGTKVGDSDGKNIDNNFFVRAGFQIYLNR